MMTVKELLEAKGSEVIAMEAGSSVQAAIRTMTEKKISAVLVTDGGQPVGIFTERDVLRCYSSHMDCPFGDVQLREAMTANLIVAELDEDLCAIMSVMVDRNIRHMPVARDGSILGMLSIRDVVKTQVKKLHTEIHYLKDYVSGI